MNQNVHVHSIIWISDRLQSFQIMCYPIFHDFQRVKGQLGVNGKHARKFYGTVQQFCYNLISIPISDRATEVKKLGKTVSPDMGLEPMTLRLLLEELSS